MVACEGRRKVARSQKRRKLCFDIDEKQCTAEHSRELDPEGGIKTTPNKSEKNG